MNDLELDTLLTEADPAAGVDLTPGAARTLLSQTLSPATHPTPRRWRRRLVRAAIGAFAVVLAAPVVSYGVNYLALTGHYSDLNTGANKPSGSPEEQEVNIKAADFPDFYASTWPDYVILPSSYDRKTFIHAAGEIKRKAEMSNDIAQGAPGILTSVQDIHRSQEGLARCAWNQEWLDADAAEATGSAKRAAQVMADSAHWPATVATDGGGVVDGLTTVAHAAATGDRAVVQNEVDINCPDTRSYPGAGR